MANWLSPVSCFIFKQVVLFELLVSNYMSGVPVN